MDDMGKRALSVPEAALSHPEWREPQVRESIGAISRAAVSRIAETGDLSDLADRYLDYDIYKTQVDSFDAADPGAPPMSGTFVTVFLCRKEMQFNCGQRESAKAKNSRP